MSKIEELKLLIAQSEEKIKQKMSEISEINQKIKIKQEEIQNAEDALNEKPLPKILTQKQKREVEKKKDQDLLL